MNKAAASLAIAIFCAAFVRTEGEKIGHLVSALIDLYNAPSELYETDEPLVYAAALSTAIMLPGDRLRKRAKRLELVPLLSKPATYCRLSKYWHRQRRSFGRCTGFLVEDDLLVTAAHCLGREPHKACASHVWLFGYGLRGIGHDPYSVNGDDIYGCRQIVSMAFDRSDIHGRDFALLRLDRPVEGRVPLRIRGNGEAATNARLTAIGYPEGLPVKVGRIGSVNADGGGRFTFSADIDVFHGYSGGPVINADTGLVEGIVSGIGTQEHSRTFLDWTRGCLDIPMRRKTTIINRATNIPMPSLL